MKDPGSKLGIVTLRYQKPDGSWAVEYSPSQPDSANPYDKQIQAWFRREMGKKLPKSRSSRKRAA